MSGLYLEGGSWDLRKGCIAHQKPKQLTFPLPEMKVIPVEAHRLKLQVYNCLVQGYNCTVQIQLNEIGIMI